MLGILREQPWTILLAGGFIAAVLLFAWTQLRHPKLLLSAAIVLGITGVLIAVERLWVTDREALIATLYHIADDIRQDNWPAVLEHIHPEAVDIRQTAEAEYRHYQLVDARITRVWEVSVDHHHAPASAVAKFNVVVTGGPRAAEISNQQVARYLIVQFRQHDGRWKVVSYNHYPPYEALRVEPTGRDSPVPTF